jgi:predicted RNA binding protein YcfA (HicA-like mRNA interferase family)
MRRLGVGHGAAGTANWCHAWGKAAAGEGGFGFILASRTYLYDIRPVRGSELVRKLRGLAKQRGVEFSYEPRHGKGSHGQLLFGDRLTTVKDLSKEIGPGLLNAMLRQLGLTKNDLP